MYAIYSVLYSVLLMSMHAPSILWFTVLNAILKARKELEALIDKRSFPKFIGSLSKDCFNLSKEPKSKEEKAAEFKKAKEDMKVK